MVTTLCGTVGQNASRLPPLRMWRIKAYRAMVTAAPLSDGKASDIDPFWHQRAGAPAIAPHGHVAEWLRNGLQNRVPRFNSGRGLQPSLA